MMQCVTTRKRVIKRRATVQVPQKIARVEDKLIDPVAHSSKKPAGKKQKSDGRSVPQRRIQPVKDDPEVINCLKELIDYGKKNLEIEYARFAEEKKMNETLLELLKNK